MPRGKHNKHNHYRGRGRGRGGGGPHRGGRGGGNGNLTTVPVQPATPGPTSSRPRPPYYPLPNAEIDVVIRQWAEPNRDVAVGWYGNRGRGGMMMPKSRSGGGTPLRGGLDSPRRGDSTPASGSGSRSGRGWRGRGRGRGRGYDPNGGDASRRPHLGVSTITKPTTLGKDAPLSDLLYAERPLLRPVKFVRATLTPFLFQHSEEVMKPASDVQADTTETSHVPTANRVAQLFHVNVSDSDSESEGHYQDALQEVDFTDLGQLRTEVDAIIAQGSATMDRDAHDAQQDIEEIDFADLATIRAQVDALESQAISREDVLEETFTSIYNHITQTSSPVQQGNALSTPNNSQPSTETQSIPQAKDTIVIDDKVRIEPRPDLSNDLSPPPPDTPTHSLFIIDTAPTYPFPNRSASDVILVDRTGHSETLGDQDEERIVYVAPHPRSGRASPVPPIPRVKLPKTSMLTTSWAVETADRVTSPSPVREDEEVHRGSTTNDIHVETHEGDHLSLDTLNICPPVAAAAASHTKAAVRAHKKEMGIRRKRQRQRKRGRMRFGAFGAMVSEARLREEDMNERRNPRWETRRSRDSDIDWGTDESEADDEVDALSNGLGGMDIDPDLDLDVGAMQGFVEGMSAEGSRFVTMDDIEDEVRMSTEDEGSRGGPEGSSDSERGNDDDDDEEEEAFNLEEGILIAESESDDELSEGSDDDDDELSPRSNFQARLRKVREQSRCGHSKTLQEISEDEEDDDDDEFMARINDILEENSYILSGRDRKQKKAVFRNLHQGYVDEMDLETWLDDPEFTTPVQKKKKQAKKNKGKQSTDVGVFASELEAQWAKDRAKKAAVKRTRATARLLAALDPLSAPSGKPSRKAMRAVARLDARARMALSTAPNALAITDVDALEAQIRRFVEDVRGGGRTSMALPPMEKRMRKLVHELAVVFGVKSVSKGIGGGRYTTLVGTSRTGVDVKENKVKTVMKRYGGGKSGGGWGREKDKGGRMPRHREGDEIGKEAPKIGESNIGFKMLASMGWSEGDRIGGTASVGIEAPLTAIIKNSKLGLGATR